MLQEEEPIYSESVAEVRWSFESNQALAGEQDCDDNAQQQQQQQQHQDQTEDENDMELTELQNLITNLNINNSKDMFYNSVNSSITLSDLGDSFLLDYDDDEDEPTETKDDCYRHDVVPTCPCRRTTCCSAADQQQQAQAVDCQPRVPGRRASDLSLKSICEHSVVVVANHHNNQSIAQVIDRLGRVADLVPTAPRRRHSDSTCRSIPEEKEVADGGGKLLHTTTAMKKTPICCSSSRPTSRRPSDSTYQSIPEGQAVHVCRWGEEQQQLQVPQRDPVSCWLRQPMRQPSAHLNATAA